MQEEGTSTYRQKSGQRFEMFISVLLLLHFKDIFYMRVFIKILIKDKDSRHKLMGYTCCTRQKAVPE